MVFAEVLGILILVTLMVTLIIFGVKLCLHNNAWGILLLFISLNFIGLVIGIILLYNYNNRTISEAEKAD